MSINGIFETGRRSLLAYQSAMNTTSKNISGVNQAGFSRRRVDFTSLTFGLPNQPGVSIGLNANQIVRVRQSFLDQQYWTEMQNLGKYSTDELLLTQLEQVFAENTDAGLSNVLSEFWAAWNDLANDPESESTRVIVRDKAVLLTNAFNRISGDLQDMQEQLVQDLDGKINRINEILHRIAQINKQMAINKSPDLLDERDRLVTELSSLMDVTVKEKESGQVVVASGGLILTSGNEVNELNLQIEHSNTRMKVKIQVANFNRELDLEFGEIGSLVETVNGRINDYLDALDTLAVSIAQQVNQIHSRGYSASGVTGTNFFANDVSGASNFRLNPAVRRDPNLIATRKASEAVGDGSVALAISDLQFSSIVNNQRVSEFYNSLLTRIGNEVQQSEFLHQTEQKIVDQLQNQIESISGVSLDEEMVRLSQYQQAYEAAGKVIKTVDEMVQTLLNIV